MRDNFIKVTCIMAAIITALFIYKAMQEGFSYGAWIIIAANAIYIPGSLLFKRKFFLYWSIFYCLILVFLIATTKSFLFNNYTALFVVFIVMAIKPEIKLPIILAYIVAVSIAFMINSETVYHYLIHLTRTAWIYYILDFFIQNKFTRKPLDLTEDEKKILDELNEVKLLKAVTCFSKNTITQKLKDARERNKIDTNAELLAEYNLMRKK